MPRDTCHGPTLGSSCSPSVNPSSSPLFTTECVMGYPTDQTMGDATVHEHSVACIKACPIAHLTARAVRCTMPWQTPRDVRRGAPWDATWVAPRLCFVPMECRMAHPVAQTMNPTAQPFLQGECRGTPHWSPRGSPWGIPLNSMRRLGHITGRTMA